MFKKLIYKKLIIFSLSIVIFLLIYLFPTLDRFEIKNTLTISNAPTIPIYLLDNNNYVSRTEIINHSDNLNEKIKTIIKTLTINDKDTSIYLSSFFNKIIPENTKILNLEIEDDLLKINFSKHILNISEELEEKMIESLIYSLTELTEINKIMIFVEGNLLNKLPKSNKYLPNILDRSYGINKVYDINSMKNINKVTTYYVSKNNDYIYYTPITTISNKEKEKIEIIIEELKSFSSYNTNLISYLSASVELQNYEILNNSVNLSFSNDILSLNDSEIIEEVKYTIALSIKDTYNINETIFYVDNVLFDTAFV